MSEEKPKPELNGKHVILFNRGQRPFHLAPKVVVDDAGNVVSTTPRILLAGMSIEALSDAEAKSLLQYREIVDAATVVPDNADRIAALRKENAELKAEIEKLKSQSVEKEPVAPRQKRW